MITPEPEPTSGFLKFSPKIKSSIVNFFSELTLLTWTTVLIDSSAISAKSGLSTLG